MSLLKHTACHPGKKVKVVLRNGVVYYGKFRDRLSRHIVIEMPDGRMEKIDKGSIKVFSIFNQHVASMQRKIIKP